MNDHHHHDPAAHCNRTDCFMTTCDGAIRTARGDAGETVSTLA